MERKRDGLSIRERAVSWVRRFVRAQEPGHSVALLHAGPRALPLVDPPSTDKVAIATALASVEPGRGSSDLALAVAESLRILERAPRAGGEVIFLSDSQRLAWRPDESTRWDLLREMHGRLPFPPELIALNFAEPSSTASSENPDGAIGPLEVARPLVASSQPFAVTTTLYNAGRGPLHRRVELLIDGRVADGTPRSVGPVPPGGQVPLVFETAIAVPGLHELHARIVEEDDANPADNEVADVVSVTDRLEVLLVDGAQPRTSGRLSRFPERCAVPRITRKRCLPIPVPRHRPAPPAHHRGALLQV